MLGSILALIWGNVPYTEEHLAFVDTAYLMYQYLMWFALLAIALEAVRIAWWLAIPGGILFVAPSVLFTLYWSGQGNVLICHYTHPSVHALWLLRFAVTVLLLFLVRHLYCQYSGTPKKVWGFLPIPVIQTILVYLLYVVGNLIFLTWGNIPKGLELLKMGIGKTTYGLYTLLLLAALCYTILSIYQKPWWSLILGALLLFGPPLVFALFWIPQKGAMFYGHPLTLITPLLRYLAIALIVFFLGRIGGKYREAV